MNEFELAGSALATLLDVTLPEQVQTLTDPSKLVSHSQTTISETDDSQSTSIVHQNTLHSISIMSGALPCWMVKATIY